MDFFKTKNKTTAPQLPTPAPAPQIAQPASSGGLLAKKVTKGGTALLARKSGGGDEITLITTWGQKDYDLYALVEYVDGHVEVVSCFGTVKRPRDYSLQSSDGAVVHYSGDKTAYGADTPQEVIHIKLNPRIKCVVPVVYSAKNSGTGSFHRYKVSTYVVRGKHTNVPRDGSAEMVQVEAVDANRDDNVYTFVPAIITSGPEGASIEAVELYSRRSSELRPTVSQGKVRMDAGEENSSK